MTRAVERLARAWAVLTWRRWAWATALAVALASVMPFIRFDVSNFWAVQRALYHAPWYALFAYFFLLAIAWVESSRRDTAPDLWRYSAAAFGAAVLCVVVTVSLAPLVAKPPIRVVEGLVVKPPKGIPAETTQRITAVASLGQEGAFFGFLATIIYARLRNARRMALSLSRAELARSEASRGLLAARLAAARAEINPAHVIERLEAIARIYEEDTSAAEAQLDELIAALREAIPRLRQEALVTH